MLKSERARDQLKGSGGGEWIPGHTLDGTDRNTLCQRTENSPDHFHFGGIQVWVAGTVGADVIDFMRLAAGIGHGKPHCIFQTDERIVSIVVHLGGISGDFKVDARAPRHGVLETFDHHDR